MTFSQPFDLFIKEQIHTSEEYSDFFIRIFKDKILAENCIKIILSDLRNCQKNAKAMISCFQNIETFLNWYNSKNGYRSAYSKYIKNKWEGVNKIDDFIKYIPNLTPWFAEQKFGMFSIGEIPETFDGIETFENLVKQIYESEVVKNFNIIKPILADWHQLTEIYPEFSKYDTKDMAEKANATSNLLKTKCGCPFSVTINNKEYEVTFMCNPFTLKMVFNIKVSDGNEYFIKSLSSYPEQDGSVDKRVFENQYIRADSPYSNSLIEFYLKYNNCKNSADILFYSHKYCATLYKKTIGTQVKNIEAIENAYPFTEFNRNYLNDACNLGIFVNDLNIHNFIEAENGDVKIIDIGNCSYSSLLNPGIIGLCYSINNLCGNDPLVHIGGLYI